MTLARLLAMKAGLDRAGIACELVERRAALEIANSVDSTELGAIEPQTRARDRIGLSRRAAVRDRSEALAHVDRVLGPLRRRAVAGERRAAVRRVHTEDEAPGESPYQKQSMRTWRPPRRAST